MFTLGKMLCWAQHTYTQNTVNRSPDNGPALNANVLSSN
ncbi:hypothetical protein CBM2631_A90292 [Cupriavidus taiwanensis]|nr:hypothetical protein CBM2631_A90292 [Cupriavidus taiwanensis]